MTVAAISRIKPQSLPRTDSVDSTLHRVAKRSFPAKPPVVAEPQPRHTRLAVALLASLLAHTALIFRLGGPLPLPPPEIPPRILLNLTQAPPPPVIEPPAPAPLPPVITSEAAPPAPVIEPPPPPPKPKLLPVKPRPRAEAKRPDPKPTRPQVAQPPPPRSSPPAAVINTPPAPVQPRPLSPPAEPVSEPPPLILNPRYRSPPTPPVYPRSAIRLEQQGRVLVQARISTAGDVIEIRVHQSSGHPALDTAALAAVRDWAFVPATRNNQPVEAWVRVPVHFVLNHH